MKRIKFGIWKIFLIHFELIWTIRHLDFVHKEHWECLRLLLGEIHCVEIAERLQPGAKGLHLRAQLWLFVKEVLRKLIQPCLVKECLLFRDIGENLISLWIHSVKTILSRNATADFVVAIERLLLLRRRSRAQPKKISLGNFAAVLGSNNWSKGLHQSWQRAWMRLAELRPLLFHWRNILLQCLLLSQFLAGLREVL